jgi:hypothetical protein
MQKHAGDGDLREVLRYSSFSGACGKTSAAKGRKEKNGVGEYNIG